MVHKFINKNYDGIPGIRGAINYYALNASIIVHILISKAE